MRHLVTCNKTDKCNKACAEKSPHIFNFKCIIKSGKRCNGYNTVYCSPVKVLVINTYKKVSVHV